MGKHVDDGMTKFEKAMILLAAVFCSLTFLMLFAGILANFLVSKGVV